MPGSRIVATGVKEFDYPQGNQNVYTSYQGKGGIPIDSLAKRLLFTWTQADINILLTGYLKPEAGFRSGATFRSGWRPWRPSCNSTRILMRS
jgi:hypothetical protein